MPLLFLNQYFSASLNLQVCNRYLDRILSEVLSLTITSENSPANASRYRQSPIVATPKHCQKSESLDTHIESTADSAGTVVTQSKSFEMTQPPCSSPSMFAHYDMQMINTIFFGADIVGDAKNWNKIDENSQHSNVPIKFTVSQSTQTIPETINNCTQLMVVDGAENAQPSDADYLNFTESEFSLLSQRLRIDEFDLLRNIYEIREHANPTISLAHASNSTNNDDHELSELDRCYIAIIGNVNNGDDMSVSEISATPPNSPLSPFKFDGQLFSDE